MTKIKPLKAGKQKSSNELTDPEKQPSVHGLTAAETTLRGLKESYRQCVSRLQAACKPITNCV